MAVRQDSLRSTIEGHAPGVVGRIKQLAKAKRGRRSRSTRQIAATLSSRGTLISHTSVCRALHSKGVKPYVQPQVPLQRYGDKQRRLRFAAEQKERDCDVVCLPMRSLLHRFTSRSLNLLCCQQREIGSVADTGPMYKTAIRSTLQN